MSCNTLPPCCNAHRFVATPHPCDVATPRNPLPSLRLATLPPLLQRLSLCFPYCDASRPFATFCNPWQYFPLPLTVRVRPTSCNAYLALMQHPVRCKLQRFPPPPSAHLRSMSCNTPMRALYLATPRTQPFPRVRMSCNTPQSALSPRAHVLQHPTVRPSPACACLATPHSPPFPHVRMSCNTPQSALPPRAHTKLQHLTVRPSPACACLATPHGPPFPRVRMSCNTSQSALPPPAVCALCIATRISRPHASPHSPHLPRLPACAYVLPISPSCKM